MDYTNLLNELNKASTFDLYRLHVAIGNELEHPNRIISIKRKLRIGMVLSYFCAVENRLKESRLIEMKQKNVVVMDAEQNKPFVVPYYMLNVNGMDVDIHASKHHETLTANMLKVGDCVGFSRDGKDIVGVIKRINHKTVTLETMNQGQWRVAYACLYRVHDSEVINYFNLECNNTT